MRALVITQPFGDFQKGEIITDRATVEDLVGSDWAANFVVTEQPDAPAPSGKAPAASPAES